MESNFLDIIGRTPIVASLIIACKSGVHAVAFLIKINLD